MALQNAGDSEHSIGGSNPDSRNLKELSVVSLQDVF